MTKVCSCCERKHEVNYCINNSYAQSELGYWFNCSCGSTLLIPINSLNYAEFNRIKTQRTRYSLNYKAMANE